MRSDKRKWIVLAAASIMIAMLLSPLASSHPDGLERVAEDHGFIEQSQPGFALSPFPDYVMEVPLSSRWQGALAGGAGVAIMLAAIWGYGRLLARK